MDASDHTGEADPQTASGVIDGGSLLQGMDTRCPDARSRAPDERPHPPAGSALAVSPGLEGEIELLRRTVRRLYDLAQAQDPDEAVKTLNVLSSAAARLARVVQTQAHLHGSDDGGLGALLSQALAEVQKEMGI